MRQPKIEEGSVIAGTLRPEDLIPAFAREMRRIMPPDPRPHTSLTQLLDFADQCDTLSGEERDEVVELLIEALWGFAPEGFYFGSHPDDGADFGFWRYEEEV